jgi:hypothetical protein
MEQVKDTMDTNDCNSVLRMDSQFDTNDTKSLSRVDSPQVESNTPAIWTRYLLFVNRVIMNVR